MLENRNFAVEFSSPNPKGIHKIVVPPLEVEEIGAYIRKYSLQKAGKGYLGELCRMSRTSQHQHCGVRVGGKAFQANGTAV